MAEYTSTSRMNVGLLETLNLLMEEKESVGAMMKGFAKNLKRLNFLGMLYTLKVRLSSLIALSKNFQSRALIFKQLFQMYLKKKRNFSNFSKMVKPLIC